MELLTIRGLSVEYVRRHQVIPAVRGVSLSVNEGETVAIVGESGSGKSTLALAALGLILPQDGRITAGSIEYCGKDLAHQSPAEWRALRGKELAMVFQDPFSSLNPVLTAGEQIAETVRAHAPGLPEAVCREQVLQSLKEVMFADPARIAAAYPHQLSGGQRQRVVIAMAIVNRPRILIADEPTTALDVTIQKDILDLIDRLKKELSLTVLLITHNLPLACERSQRIAVMYAGEIVETNRTGELFRAPRHPYTRALIRSVPRLAAGGTRFVLGGQVPDPCALPAGCAFADRCADVMEQCRTRRPPPVAADECTVACFRCGRKD
jgi:oligopeptide/dipeptide ABC transporter ATP-binding protein